MTIPSRLLRSLRSELLVLALLAVAVITVTYPLVLNLDRLVMGVDSMPDLIGQLWYSRWMATVFTEGLNPNHADTVMLPAGCVDLLVKRGPCLVYALTIPFQSIVSLLASFNLTVLSSLLFTAYAAYRLVLYTVRDHRVALLCGLTLVVHPVVGNSMWHAQLDQMTLGFHFLFFLFLLRALRERGWGAPVAAACALWLAGLTYLGFSQILVVLAVPLLVPFAWRMVRARKLDHGVLWRLLLFSAVFIVLMAPILVLFTSHAPGTSLPVEEDAHLPLLHPPSSSEELGLATRIIVEGSLKKLWPLNKAYSFHGLGAWVTRSSLLLALLGFLTNRASAYKWLGLALLAMVIAFGPYLEWPVGGSPGADAHLIPLPGLIVYRLVPFLSRLRFPYRFMTGLVVAVTVLAGFGLRSLLHWLPPRAGIRIGFVLAATTLFAMEYRASTKYFLPTRLGRLPAVPEFYREALPAEPGDFAIITVPLVLHKPTPEEEAREPRSGATAFQLYNQLYHEKRMLGGRSLALSPPTVYDRFLQTNSLLVNIVRWQADAAASPVPLLALDLDVLPELGFRYLVLERPFLLPDSRSAMEGYLSQLFGDPTHDDHDGTMVFDVRGIGAARRAATAGRVALTGRREAAEIEGLRGKIEAAPEDLASRLALVRLLAGSGDYGPAESELRQAAGLAPGSSEVLALRLELQTALGRFDQARDSAQALLVMDPSDPQAAAALDLATRELGLRASTAGTPAVLAQAAVDIEAGHPWAAIERVEHLPLGQPLEADAHHLMAQAYETLGLPAQAAEHVRAALALQPDLAIDTSCLQLPAVVRPAADQRLVRE